jgi:AraC-like DNA-binding protein
LLEIGSSLLFKFALIAGITQGIFFLFALGSIKNKAPLASKLLKGIFLTLILSISGRFAYDFNVHQQFPHLFLFVDFCLFLFGPLYFFYAKSVLYSDFKIGKKERLHFLPALIHLLSLGVQFAIEGSRFFEMVQNRNELLYNFWYATEGFAILSILVYLFLTFKTLKKYNSSQTDKEVDKFKLKYFRVITTLMLLSMSIWIVSFGNLMISGHRIMWAFDLTWLPMIIINFVIGYYMIIKPNFFKAEINKPAPIVQVVPEDILEKLKEELIFIIESKKPFLNPELTVNDLASIMGIKSHLATKVLSQGLDTNFFELINYYRINEFVRMVSEDLGSRTFLSVAFEAGFNSKTTFNKAFKREKGVSPRDYFKLKKVG